MKKMMNLSFRERAELKKKQAEEKAREAELQAKKDEKKKKKKNNEPEAGVAAESEANPQLPAPLAIEASKQSKSKDCVIALEPAEKKATKAKNPKRKAESPVEDHPAKRVSHPSVEPILQGGVNTSAQDPNDPYVEPNASARVVAKFCRPGQPPLEPASLEFSSGYSEVALRTVKLAAHVNQLVADYQGEIDLSKKRVEDARKIAVDANAKLEQVQQEKANLKTKLKLAGEQIQVLENSKKRKDQAIENVTKDWEEAVAKLNEANKKLGEANQHKEAEIFDAVVNAKRDVTRKFHSRIAKARKCFEEINGEALVNMRDLFEMKSNLLLLSILQKEDAPTLEDEAKSVRENMESIKGADEHFDRLMLELNEALSVDPSDELAASAGICEPSGSNRGAPGINEFISKELVDPTVADPSASNPDPEDKGAPEMTMAEFVKSVQQDDVSGLRVMVNFDENEAETSTGEEEVTGAEAKMADP